jgi:hypothetical protein
MVSAYTEPADTKPGTVPAYTEPHDTKPGGTPAHTEPVRPHSGAVEEGPTAAIESFDPGSNAAEGPAAPAPETDEHESHTLILPSIPSLRTSTRLVVLEGPVHGRQFALSRQSTTIGRSIGCHVTVDAEAVAYDHARIVRAGESWQIEVVGGASDLLVNEEQVRDSRALQHGDVIRIGPARLRFETAS